jgi:hypothetical protein
LAEAVNQRKTHNYGQKEKGQAEKQWLTKHCLNFLSIAEK